MTPRPTFGGGLPLTLGVSLAVHGILILALGFTAPPSKPTRTPPMIEVTLAPQPQQREPEEHDFLAQANQDGGGQAEEANIPEQRQPASSTSVPERRQPADNAPVANPRPPSQQRQEVTGHDRATRQGKATPQTPPKPKPSAAELLSTSREVALSSQLAEATESVDARYPSKRRISARTKAHAAAAYMRGWVEKVEQIGNLNYPREARARGLSGRLVLEVTLRPDGSVNDVRILRPSAHPPLDQAALRVVDLAAPFSQVPEPVLAGNDLLVITRTWEFDDGRKFSAR